MLQAVSRGVGRLGVPCRRVGGRQVGRAAVARRVGTAVVVAAARQRRRHLEFVEAQRLQASYVSHYIARYPKTLKPSTPSAFVT